jgi:hypothetical protein
MALARKWNLPDSSVRAIDQSRAYARALPRSASNVVCLANALAKRAGLYVGPVDSDEVEACIQQGRALLGVSDVVMGRACANLQIRVNSMTPDSGAAPAGPRTRRLRGPAAHA